MEPRRQKAGHPNGHGHCLLPWLGFSFHYRTSVPLGSSVNFTDFTIAGSVVSGIAG